MAVRIVSWNVEGRLSAIVSDGRGSPSQIVDEVGKLDADIVFLPEATIDGTAAPGIDARLEQQGYALYEAKYNDAGTRPHDAETSPTMRFLSRLTLTDVQQPRYGDIRTMLTATVEDPDTQALVQLFGIHLDDRSTAYRMQQMPELIDAVNAAALPTILIGDFNATNKNDFRAKLVGSRYVRAAIGLTTWGLIGYIARRLSEMGNGVEIEMLEKQTALQEVDNRYAATVTPKSRDMPWLPSIAMFQIDHIVASPALTVSDFMVHGDGGSDHRALSATVCALKS